MIIIISISTFSVCACTLYVGGEKCSHYYKGVVEHSCTRHNGCKKKAEMKQSVLKIQLLTLWGRFKWKGHYYQVCLLNIKPQATDG